MNSWIIDYKSQINEQIALYFSHVYQEGGGNHEEFLRDAIIYAIKTEETKRIHTILAMIAFEEVGGMEADTVLHILIGIEFFYTGLLIHADVIGVRDVFSDSSPLLIKKYGENLSVAVGDILFELGVEILTQAGDTKVFHEAMMGFGHTGYMRGVARDVITDHSVISEQEYLLMYDEKISRGLLASLLCGGQLAGGLIPTISDQFRQFATFLARMHQVSKDIRLYESVRDNPVSSLTRQRGVVDFLGYEKAREIESELYYQLMETTKNFRNTKFIDIIELFRSGEIGEF